MFDLFNIIVFIWCLLVYSISQQWSHFLFFLQYIGSFSVTGADPNERAENVQKQLEQMRVSLDQLLTGGNCPLNCKHKVKLSGVNLYKK